MCTFINFLRSKKSANKLRKSRISAWVKYDLLCSGIGKSGKPMTSLGRFVLENKDHLFIFIHHKIQTTQKDNSLISIYN